MGPLLFLVFINDIEEKINSDIYLFADDTTLAYEYKNVLRAEEMLNTDLLTISEWAKKWFVKLNVKKTVLINFFVKEKKVKPKNIF